jgi:hypothetical protein
MMNEEVVAVASLAIGLAIRARRIKKKKVKKCKRLWVKDWISHRNEKGAYGALMMELQLNDVASFKNFIRMRLEDFQLLVSKFEVVFP